MIKVFLTNLGKYNEGYLIGEWLELPASQQEIDETMAKIGINEEYEEWFITDYETDIKGIEIGEYSNLHKLNEIAEELDELEEDAQETIQAMLLDGYTFNEALEKASNGDYRIYYECYNMIDVAMEIVEECGDLNGVSEKIAIYFDYEAFSRDLEIEGNFKALSNRRYIEIL